jgi:hypothetical protein
MANITPQASYHQLNNKPIYRIKTKLLNWGFFCFLAHQYNKRLLGFFNGYRVENQTLIFYFG